MGQAASKLEADSLREELVELKAELKKFNKTRLAARGQPEREQVRRRPYPARKHDDNFAANASTP